MKSSYLESDVRILHTDIKSRIIPMELEDREEIIKNGVKPYELLAYETTPSDEDEKIYNLSLELFSQKIANAIQLVSEKIYLAKGKKLVLVSLARAGISISVLIKRFLEKKYNIKIYHYSLSVIGTMNIDFNALDYIVNKHGSDKIQFVDGWTGKGSVQKTLKKGLSCYPNIDNNLAVLCDPGYFADLAGTHGDILVPSATLNSTTSGLLSRAVYNKSIIDENEFFGAVFFSELSTRDKTYDFIDKISSLFDFTLTSKCEKKAVPNTSLIFNSILYKYGIKDLHFIKPGLGETFRAINRKKPTLILINENNSVVDKNLMLLLNQLSIKLEKYPLGNFGTCGIYCDPDSDIL